MKLKLPEFKDIMAAIGFLAVLAVLVYGGMWAWRTYRSTGAKVDFGRYPVRGIDVSAHNGDIDFEKVADSGIRFAWIKASEGETVRDKRFMENYTGAVAGGLRSGAYHFFRFDCEGISQAQNLCNALDNIKPQMGVAIDVELEGNPDGIDDETVIRHLHDMIDYLNLKGLPVTLYTNKEGYSRFLAREFEDLPLWICSFTDYEPMGEMNWSFWQYTHSGSVPGVPGNCDMNVFYGSYPQLKQFPMN